MSVTSAGPSGSRNVIPFESTGMPESILELARLRSGLILFTGSTGAGKTTSMFSVADHLLKTTDRRLAVLESPAEIKLANQVGSVNHFEVGRNADSDMNAFEQALRMAPDVILMSELNDPEFMSNAIRGAETGHLVFSTMHCASAAEALSRILDNLQAEHPQDLRNRLAANLTAVIHHKKLPSMDGQGSVRAYEVLIVDPVVSNLIRSNDLKRIEEWMLVAGPGTVLLEQSLARLVREGKITLETALQNAGRGLTTLEFFLNQK